MNCVNVQNALWIGQLTDDMESHIQHCDKCKEEQSSLQTITGQLSNPSVPKPTRSLLPDASVIRASVKKARRRPAWRSMTTYSAIAAIVLVVAGGLTWAGHVPDHPADGQTAAHGGGNAAAVSNPFSQQGQSHSNQLATSASTTGIVDVSPTANNPEQCKLIEQYFDKRSATALKGIKHMTIADFTPDAKQPNANVILGTFKLEIQLVEAAQSPYSNGMNTRFVEITKQQGVWTVEQVASSPFDNQDIGAWNQSFPSSAVQIQGTIVDWKLVDNMLMELTVKIDPTGVKDPTPGLQGGQTLPISIDHGNITPNVKTSFLKKGETVIVEVAQANPATHAGMTVFHTVSLDYLYHLESDGWFHSMDGSKIGDLPQNGSTSGNG